MKTFVATFLGLATLAGSAAAAPTCADFSGTWVGTCTGQQADGRLQRLELKQTGCDALFTVGDGLSLKLDGQIHKVAGGQYIATWADAKQLRLDLTSGVEGVVMNLTMQFAQTASGKQTYTQTTSRSVPGLGGESEPLETCSYAKE